MGRILKLKDFEPKGSHHIFLDANILIYAFAPLANYKIQIQEQITKFLESARKVNASLYVTSLVLSEVYNVLLSASFDNWKASRMTAHSLNLKKDFRPTEEFKDSTLAINSAIKNILKLASPFPDNFNNSDAEIISKMCYYADYNDCCFLELAQQKNWMIFTRDNDIINHPMRTIDIITNLG
ncbi:hypothetical protein N180_01765 [Pedobacter antarcticus 4BY]|uniref:PIN domain-containing protein n=2 Tax=Pedobacter antarcticus TaxID=34086 RepID=A0A081PCG2_9SPHI|nr:type II toxin-antitoxin system VapC family toxin [Pedobacter antarcticus]KEQ28385.1 hypothetical protein N180_01765 [Pedobacter antarcticus 4BY]SFF05285.1 PIN domain-containing protein [Pedobacter antarcticus]